MEGKPIGKIKILFTIPNFDTAGSGKALLKIAAGLDKEMFTPSILCVRDHGEFFETVKNSGIPVHFFEYRANFLNKLSGLKECYKISKFIRSLGQDLIHSFNYSDDYSEALSSKLASVKWIYSKKNMMWNSNAWKLRSFLADGIIALNYDMVEKYFKNSRKVTLIPRGVDLNEFSFGSKSDLSLNKYKLSNNDKILLCIANFAPVKGIDNLLTAFDKLSKEHVNLKLIIVGDYNNAYGKEILSKYIHLTDSNKLIITGKRLDTKYFYNLSDFFILPTSSRGEGTSVAILEAMASGCPVLASDVPGNKDQLKLLPSQLFKPENSELLISKINEFLSKSVNEINDIRQKQREIVNEYYSLDTEIKKHEQFYLKIFKTD